MIDGIAVLSQQTIRTANVWTLLLGICMMISFCFMIPMWQILFTPKHNRVSFRTFVVSIVSACVLFFIGMGILFSVSVIASYFNRQIYIEYKVTIEDSVRFNDFNDYYEILDQEGAIFTIKEK